MLLRSSVYIFWKSLGPKRGRVGGGVFVCVLAVSSAVSHVSEHLLSGVVSKRGIHNFCFMLF